MWLGDSTNLYDEERHRVRIFLAGEDAHYVAFNLHGGTDDDSAEIPGRLHHGVFLLNLAGRTPAHKVPKLRLSQSSDHNVGGGTESSQL